MVQWMTGFRRDLSFGGLAGIEPDFGDIWKIGEKSGCCGTVSYREYMPIAQYRYRLVIYLFT